MSRQMKDSGVAWIGNIPVNWSVQKVKNAFYRSKDEAHIEEPIVLSLARSGVKVRDISNNEGQLAESYYNYNPVVPGDLLLNPMDLYSGANCSVSKVEGVISPAYINLRTKGEYCPTYYDYYFKTQYWAMALFAHGKGVSFDNRWTLSPNDLFNYAIPVPNFEEQKRIAEFLDCQCAEIDAVIAKTSVTIEEYKKLKQSIITDAVTKGIRDNRETKETGIKWIGTIPSHWSVRKLKTFASLISKGTTPKDISNEQNHIYSIRFLKSENIVDNQLVAIPEFYIEEHIHLGELKRSELTVDDILFVIAGASIGKVAIMNADLLPSNTNQAVSFIRIMPKYSDIKKYIWYVLQSDMIKTYISLFSVQSAQPNISMENLGNFRMPYVDDNKEILEIVEYLDKRCIELDNLIAKKTALLEEMETYKKSVIYEYVTGKKEV